MTIMIRLMHGAKDVMYLVCMENTLYMHALGELFQHRYDWAGKYVHSDVDMSWQIIRT